VSLHRQRPGIDLSFSWFQLIDETGRLLGAHSRRYRGSVDFGDLLEDFVIAASSNVMARREAIEKAGGVDPDIPRLYDLDLFLRIALLAPGNIEAIPADLMLYRRRTNQITSNPEPLRREWEMVLDKMRILAPAEVAARQQRARSNNNRYWARLAYESEAYRNGLQYLRAGFADAPAYFMKDPRNWTTAAGCLCGLVLPRRLHYALERIAGLNFRA
jgi:hypothetical protein